MQNSIDNPSFSSLNSPFTIAELSKAISNSKSNAVGSDLIHIKMLKNLNSENLAHLLFLLNLLYDNGYCPSDWKSAIILPLLKTGKPKEEPVSYRPISITSTLGKCFERLINSRLLWHLEAHNFIPINQAAFRKNCSIHDHIWNIESSIISGFNNGMDTHGVFIDLDKAYDTVWIHRPPL